jgi:hypothetical protein
MSLQEAKIMSLIDLEAGFWQVPVDEESAKLLTFSTPWGRFEYRRLPFGISIAPEIFHKAVVDTLAGIQGVEVFVDDIFVHGPNQQEHDKRVREVKKRLVENGFTPNEEKCQLSRTKLKFLGHVIGEGQVSPDPEKIQAILDAPEPTTRKDLKSFMGALSWMRKHIPKLNTLLESFRHLQKERTPWTWTDAETKKFREIKDAIRGILPLMMIRPGESMTVAADASSYGLGAVLTQKDEHENERPIFFASRLMTDAETKWAQVDKELLAIAWAMERLDNFVYGRKIRVKTDHKPLLGLVKKPLAHLSSRQQRLMARLMRYDFELEYTPGKDLVVPDFLSRATTREEPECRCKFMATDVPLEEAHVSMINTAPLSKELQELVEKKAKEDQEYVKMGEAYDKGWPGVEKENCGEYWSVRENIVAEDGLLYRSGVLVIPKGARPRLMASLHRAHVGLHTMRKRAEETIWWPGIWSDLKDLRRDCSQCQVLMPAQQKETMCSFKVPPAPGLEWHSDYLEWAGQEYVLYTDAFSGWTETYTARTRTANDLKKITRLHFLRHGIPRRIHSDQGSAYMAEEFKEFCKKWGVEIVTASAKHSQGNAIAESAVKKIKRAIKSAETEDELVQALLAIQQTPLAMGRPSPAQLHFGRNLRDEIHDKVQRADVEWPEVQAFKEQRKAQEKKKYDRTARDLPDLTQGQRVRVKWNEEWKSAEVLEKIAERPRSYRLRMKNSGRIVERNRVMIRARNDDGEVARKFINPRFLFQQEVPPRPSRVRMRTTLMNQEPTTAAPPPDNDFSRSQERTPTSPQPPATSAADSGNFPPRPTKPTKPTTKKTAKPRKPKPPPPPPPPEPEPTSTMSGRTVRGPKRLITEM